MRELGRGVPLFLSFSAAVFLAVYLLPPGLWPWLGLATLLPAGLGLWRRRELAALLCLGAAAGLLWCGAYRWMFLRPAEQLDGRQTTVEVTVVERPQTSPYGGYVICRVRQPGLASVKATLYGSREVLELSPGDRVRLRANCAQTALLEDARYSYLASRGVFLRLTAKGAMTVEPAERTPWWYLPRQWSAAMGERIGRAVDGDVAGLLTALVTGDRSGLDEGVKSDLSRSGISHLVAVSGMHVCFLVGLLTALTGYEPKRRALLCVPVLILFALAVGGAPSVLRACLLQFSLLLADLVGREGDRWSALSATLALLLLFDPFSCTNVGLQLSFAAVAGIGLITPRLSELTARLRLSTTGFWAGLVNGLARFFTGLLCTTLGAMAFTVPLTALYFNSFSLAAPVTNLLVLPVAPLLFAATLVTGLLGFVLPGAAAALGAALGLVGRYVLWVARALAERPYAAVSMTQNCYPIALLGLYALILTALLWRSQRRRVWVFLSCGALILGGSILFTRLTFRAGELTAAVLDVGQGQSVLLASQGQVAVVDCGGNGPDSAGEICADYLQDRGEGRVELLILTHYHADHTNGLDELFHRLEIREVVMPLMERDEDTQIHILRLAQAENAKVTWLDSDRTLTLGEARLRLYAPLGDGGANEEGLSVLAQSGDFRMLITGDMNTAVEEALVAHAHLPKCQVLVAGHHGSRYASGETLLDAIRPETAVISVGENTYGHPAPDTLERLAERSVAVYRTDTQGTVTLQTHG